MNTPTTPPTKYYLQLVVSLVSKEMDPLPGGNHDADNHQITTYFRRIVRGDSGEITNANFDMVTAQIRRLAQLAQDSYTHYHSLSRKQTNVERAT